MQKLELLILTMNFNYLMMTRYLSGFLMIILFVQCKTECQNCLSLKSSSVNYNFQVDPNRWYAIGGIGKNSDYLLQSDVSSLTVMIYSAKNEYQNTSPLMKALIDKEDINDETILPITYDRKTTLKKKEFSIYKSESLDSYYDDTYNFTYFEYAGFDFSLCFVLRYNKADPKVDEATFEDIVSGLLTE